MPLLLTMAQLMQCMTRYHVHFHCGCDSLHTLFRVVMNSLLVTLFAPSHALDETGVFGSICHHQFP